MAREISGTAVAVTAGGFVLLYSAIKGATISTTVRSFLAGNPVAGPAPGFGNGVGSVPGNGNAPPTASGGSAFNATKDYMLGTLAFSKAGTAGALGNIQRESGFDNTNDTGDGGTSGGICQWHAGRFSTLKAYAAAHNLPWTDIRAQLGYMQLELNTGYGDVRLRMMAAGNPEAAALYWGARFEGCTECHSGTAEMIARQQAARSFYNQL